MLVKTIYIFVNHLQIMAKKIKNTMTETTFTQNRSKDKNCIFIIRILQTVSLIIIGLSVCRIFCIIHLNCIHNFQLINWTILNRSDVIYMFVYIFGTFVTSKLENTHCTTHTRTRTYATLNIMALRVYYRISGIYS